jgi:hypothetical protein
MGGDSDLHDPKVKRDPHNASQNPLVNAWWAFEALLDRLGLGWMLHYAPPELELPELKEFTSTSALSLLPDDYQFFVREVGYPMVGTKLFCDLAWSFLPPAVIAAHAKLIPPSDEERGDATAAFFATYFDIGDMWGYAFLPDDDGRSVVWHCTEGGAPRSALGPFTAWMTEELARLSKWATGLSASDRAELFARADGPDEWPDDPHHLIFASTC